MTDSISREKLQELIDRWRFDYAQRAGSAGVTEAANAYEGCADELEKVME